MKTYRYGHKKNILGTEWYSIERRVLGFIWIEEHAFPTAGEMLRTIEALKRGQNICIKIN